MLHCSMNAQETGKDTRQTQRENRPTRMFCRFKHLSRAVHEEQQHEHGERAYPRNKKEEMSSTSLTVWRKSLLMNCKGFTVIGSDGNLVYRVDNYVGRPQEVVLMDASGNSVLTMLRRKKLGVVDSWVVYEGEVMKGKHGTRKNPICCVRKHTNMLKLLGNPNPNVKAYVYNGGSDKRYAYAIEGSYAQRMCKVLDETRRVVAEIKRKEALREHVSFGIEIFHLVVHPGFDPAFAMALVLLLDQM